ncbi:MAG: glycoside hydrolase family 38 C-terminal domain-containing protein [Anaerolineales bacterium]
MTTLHLISHTHWDREWYRTFQQFRLRLVHLMDGLLDEMETSHQFRFFMLDGQTIVLEDYLQMRPEREEAIRTLARSGRLIIGPWYVLPDEFLVSPEAIIRNLLTGDRLCRRFGPKMRVGYIPDPFGHIGQMPQILKGFGIQAACVQRGLSDEPCEFWWQAPDGSRVFMAYLRDGYGNAAGLPTGDPERFVAEVRRLRDRLTPHAAAPHLLLMHGTDHMEPPFDTPQAIAAARGQLDGDELIHSTLPDYLTAVQAALLGKYLPTVVGELRSPKRHHLLPGVLSTRMWIKQRNRACETLLEKWAEPFSTFARWNLEASKHANLQPFQPANIIREAWKLLLQCHPHDSICGCSIDQVHDEMRPRFDQVEQIGEEITRQSLETLAGLIETGRGSQTMDRAPSSAVVVFNPHSFPRTDAVTVEVESPVPFDLLDETGRALPYETEGLGGRELVHAEMTAAELGGLYGNIRDGRVMGLSILGVEIERRGDTVHLTARLSETRPPDLAAWQRALGEIETLLADPTVTTFRLRALAADKIRLTFAAPEVPGLGWRTFSLLPRPEASAAPVRLPPLARLLLPLAKLPFVQKLAARPPRPRPPYRIENEFFLVEAERDGTLTLTEKSSGAVYRGLNRFVDGGDCGDEYNYAPPPADRLFTPRLRRVSIERGPVRQTLRLDLELRLSAALAPDRQSRSKETVRNHLTSHITLTSGVPRVDIRTTVNNAARDHRLRVHFPAPFAVEKAEYDGHFEVVERRVGVPPYDETWVEQPRPEVPQRAFTSLSDGHNRLTVANRGLPEVEVLENAAGNAEIALTLLRCVGWLSRDDFSTRRGHAGPYLATPGAQMLGQWEFDYAVIAGRDFISSVEQSSASPVGRDFISSIGRDFISPYAFETPLRAVFTDLHAGSLPPSGSFVEVSPAKFLVSAVKESEDGHGWLVRGYNLGGEDIYVSIKPWRPFKRVERVDLSEQKIENVKTEADGSVILPARKHESLSLVFLP